jgi:hypothetical protein
MSYEILATDGEYFVGGFWSADTSRIRLGDLDPIGMDQFGEYASEAIINLLPALSSERRIQASSLINDTSRKLADLPVRPVENTFTGAEDYQMLVDQQRALQGKGTDNPALAQELGEGIARAIGSHIGHTEIYYENNPFVVRDNRVVIAGTYEVEGMEFIHFSVNYLGGGDFGWPKEIGAPKSAIDAVKRLEAAAQQL